MQPALTLLLLLCTLAGTLSAQPKRGQYFAAAAHLGVNLSQIDGDYYFGYNRIGLRAGLEAQILLHPKSYLSVGFNFSQGGSRPSRQERDDLKNNTVALRLNTIEVPLLFNYRLGNKLEVGRKQEYRLFRSVSLRAGLALTRIASYRTTAVGAPQRNEAKFNFTEVADQYRNFDLTVIAGVVIPTGLRGGIIIEHNKSVLGLYQPEVKSREEVLPLFPYNLTLGYRYVLY